MQALRQLTAIQRAIAIALLGATFALGFIAGSSDDSQWPVPPNVPTGDFVVGAIASVMLATALVALGVGIARVITNIRSH